LVQLQWDVSHGRTTSAGPRVGTGRGDAAKAHPTVAVRAVSASIAAAAAAPQVGRPMSGSRVGAIVASAPRVAA
jgi:hypothetical protein